MPPKRGTLVALVLFLVASPFSGPLVGASPKIQTPVIIPSDIIGRFPVFLRERPQTKIALEALLYCS